MNKLCLLVVFLSVVLTGTACKKEEKSIVENEGTLILNENVKKIDLADYEIAQILFAEYFEDEFDENLITEASYNEASKEFSCAYVTKTYDNKYEQDEVEIRTNDFITYSYTSTESEYDEELAMRVPHSWTSTFNGLTNESKNKIIELANGKGYNTSKNLTDKDFERIFEIILENDKKNLKNTLEKNNYVLKNNFLSEGRIYYSFVQKDNEENYILVSSWMAGIYGWYVEGMSTAQIHEESRKGTSLYITEFDIIIKENLNELENIYNSLDIKR